MKFDPEIIDYIGNVVKTAQFVGCDDVIIEPGRVRGIDEARTVCIIQNEDVPDLPGGISIALGRLSLFQSRYELVRIQDKFTMEAETKVVRDKDGNDVEFARVLTMKAKGTKVEYSCINPTTIKAPARNKDESKARIQLTGEAVLLFQKGLAAMGAENVTIISNDDGVSFEFVDVNNDVFKHTFAESAEALIDDDVTFAHRYSAKTLLTLFKNDPVATFEVGGIFGLLTIKVNGLNVTVLPKV